MPRLSLTPELMDRLERLALVARRVRPGRYSGDTITNRRGSSIEFADYRAYQAGDDFRSIDWNVYCRLNRVYVKQYRAEEDLSLQLLVDVSASMQFGEPAKLEYAADLAAALGYLAITGLNRVGIAAFADTLKPVLPPHRRASHLFRLFDYLNETRPEGRTDINGSLSAFARLRRDAGIAVVISDFLDPEGYAEGLLALSARRWDVLVIHVLSDEEVNPPWRGALRAVDAETGESVSLRLSRDEREEYRIYLEHYFTEFRSFCLSHDIEYVRTTTSVPFERIVLDYLRGGLFIR